VDSYPPRRTGVQISLSLHEKQGLTLNRGSFVVFALGFALGFCHFLPNTRSFNAAISITTFSEKMQLSIFSTFTSGKIK